MTKIKTIESEKLIAQKRYEFYMFACGIIPCIAFCIFAIQSYGNIPIRNTFILTGFAAVSFAIAVVPRILRCSVFEIPPHTLVFRQDGYVALDTKESLHSFLVTEKSEFSIDGDIENIVMHQYVTLSEYGRSGSLDVKICIADRLTVAGITIEALNLFPKEVIEAMCRNNTLIIELCASQYSDRRHVIGFWLDKQLIKFQQEHMHDIVEAFSDEVKVQTLAEQIVAFIRKEISTFGVTFNQNFKIEIRQCELYKN